MTVNELISALDLLPADSQVLICTDQGTFLGLSEVRLDGSEDHFVVLDVASPS